MNKYCTVVFLVVGLAVSPAHAVNMSRDIYPLQRITKGLQQDVRSINETLRAMQERIDRLEMCLQLNDQDRRLEPSCAIKAQ